MSWCQYDLDMLEGERDAGGELSWCGRFMRRRNLSLRSRTTMCQKLPADYQDKLESFHDLIMSMCVHYVHGRSSPYL